MENLYDNLENYEDEHIVDELRRENGELKCKLEEYSVTLDKLQKDFDKLSSEFKILETNYSSLLKTAKEEIERKTQIITNLNIEKDMMVLNAIQNKNMPVLRMARNNTTLLNKNKSSVIENAKVTNNERKNQKHLSSEETTTSVSTDNLKICANKNVENLSSNQNVKENINKDDVKTKAKPLSISNRRKSMPATRSDIKFSSDDDEDNYDTASTKFQKVNHDTKPQYACKTFHEKNRLDDRYRTSETSSMDDKYSGHHKPNKDSRHRSSRYDSYRNRSRDRPKYRRHFSPEKFRRNMRNYQDSHNSRLEFNRHRVLESPSPDRLHNYQRRNRETRSRPERDEYYDNEWNRARHQDNYPIKHKLPNENEELSNKRRRHNSTNKYEEEKRCIEDKVPIPYSVPVADINYMHCQSPDYSVMPEMVSTQPIREIRLTAVTELDDPRMFSKRYALHQGDNVLSSISGRNIEFKVIDIATWGIKRVDVPKALTRRPSQCSDDIVQNIYMDIDNPVSNMSIESGEIMPYQRDELDLLMTEEISHHKQYSYDQGPSNNVPSDKLPTSKELSNLKYKIPKLKKEIEKNQEIGNNNAKQIEEKNVVGVKINNDNTHEKKFNLPISKNMKINKSPEKQLSNTSGKVGPFDTQVLTISKYENEQGKNARNHTVEGDLELSDETCDNTDNQMNINTENNTTSCKYINEVKQLDSLHCHIEESKNNPVLGLETNPEVLINEDVKKPKSKKKTHKASKEPDATIEKSKGHKKDMKVPKEIKSKFCELFGDTTSSLITPDDLGILPSESQVQTSVQYIPICEDAQDVDMLKPVDGKALHSSSITDNDVNNKNGERNMDTEIATKLQNQSKCKTTKVVSDCKKKKPKKNETDLKSSSNNKDIYSTISCDFPSGDMKTAISESQNNEYFEEKIDSPNNIQNILIQKPELSLKALATSTPHKDIDLNPVTGNSTSNSDCISNSKNNIIVSIDNNNVAIDQSSNNETLDSQTETDAPDVRIFVKRRRKVLKKSKPS